MEVKNTVANGAAIQNSHPLPGGELQAEEPEQQGEGDRDAGGRQVDENEPPEQGAPGIHRRLRATGRNGWRQSVHRPFNRGSAARCLIVSPITGGVAPPSASPGSLACHDGDAQPGAGI